MKFARASFALFRPGPAGGHVKQQNSDSAKRAWARMSVGASLVAGTLLCLPASAQKFPNLPISTDQRATADKVSQAGVPLGDLAPNAPDVYTIKSGDTLWGISGMYLRSPWRWPELWGMNLDEIRNPHLIFPGQTLYLDKSNGRARLSTTPPQAKDAVADAPAVAPEPGGELPVVRLSPQIRVSGSKTPLYAIRNRDIEPFLAEPLVLEVDELKFAPRIVATIEERMIIGRGDRVYARGPAENPVLDDQAQPRRYRIFRSAKPLIDPETREVLGFEAEFLGKAVLVRGEGSTEVRSGNNSKDAAVPATIDITAAKNDIGLGDRLASEPERQFVNFVPHPPAGPVAGRVVSIYGSNSVVNASQNQVVVINRGKQDGMEAGTVLAILSDGRQVTDYTDSSRALLKLPSERNGLLMVFRIFDRVSYGLILNVNNPVKVGDRLVNPQ